MSGIEFDRIELGVTMSVISRLERLHLERADQWHKAADRLEMAGDMKRSFQAEDLRFEALARADHISRVRVMVQVQQAVVDNLAKREEQDWMAGEWADSSLR